MDSFTKIIKDRLLELNWSIRKLGREANLSPGYVQQVHSGTIPKDETVIRIARALDLDETEMLFLARYERTSDPETRAIYKQALDVSQSVEGALSSGAAAPVKPIQIPLISYVSAGEPFQWTDQGYGPGQGLEMLDIPPGLETRLALKVYAVRVRGDSMFPYLKEGAVLFAMPESRNEIRHGDYVIFKDQDYNAWVKMVFFRDRKIIFRSLNPEFEDIVKTEDELVLIDRVIHIAL